MPLTYTESIDEIRNLIHKINVEIKKINKIRGKNEEIIFTIGNTAFNSSENRPYITPLRKISEGYVMGVVVYSQLQAIILSHHIDGKVDYIFVDCEKKLLKTKNTDYSILKKFNLDPKIDDAIPGSIEYGNISKSSHNVIKNTPIFSYKANDLIVESAWLFLTQHFKELSGRKIIIIGIGNIGSKLCLKLIESAVKVTVVTKSDKSEIIKALNKIKQDSVISNINIAENSQVSCIDADAIIGCANSAQVISEEMVEVMNPEGIVMDIGKGNISHQAYANISKKNIISWRADITPMVNSMVNNSKEMKLFYEDIFAKRNFKDFSIVSGGYIGSKYDIIVDNVHDIKNIYGVCDGTGSLMPSYDFRANKNLNEVKEYITKK